MFYVAFFYIFTSIQSLFFQVVITIAESPYQVKFLQPEYHVTIPENLQPPHLVVNLQTVQEVEGRAVHYYTVGEQLNGRLKVYNYTSGNMNTLLIV